MPTANTTEFIEMWISHPKHGNTATNRLNSCIALHKMLAPTLYSRCKGLLNWIMKLPCTERIHTRALVTNNYCAQNMLAHIYILAHISWTAQNVHTYSACSQLKLEWAQMQNDTNSTQHTHITHIPTQAKWICCSNRFQVLCVEPLDQVGLSCVLLLIFQLRGDEKDSHRMPVQTIAFGCVAVMMMGLIELCVAQIVQCWKTTNGW